MNILFHLHKLDIGGAERQLYYLIKGLAKYGHKIHIVTLYSDGPIWQEIDKLHICNLKSLDRKSRWDFSVIKQLVKYIKKNNVDVIQGWMPPCNTFSMLAGAITKTPVFLGVRASNMIFSELGGRFYPRIDGIVSRLFAKNIICNSYSGRQYCEKIGYPINKLMVIPNGTVLITSTKQKNLFEQSHNYKIGMISRIDPMKDHITALDAVSILLKRGSSIELHIYGDGEEQYVYSLKKYAEKLSIQDNVHWHGWINDIPDTMEKFDIFLSSSAYGEGMSNSIMEAMSAGRVIIATDVGDSKNLLSRADIKVGFIVPPENPTIIAETIQLIINNKQQAIARADAAKELIKTDYTVEKMIERYLEIYTAELNKM